MMRIKTNSGTLHTRKTHVTSGESLTFDDNKLLLLINKQLVLFDREKGLFPEKMSCRLSFPL